MVYRAFVVSGLILLAGCPDQNSPARQAQLALQTLGEYANKMCACKDKACADKVHDGLIDWSTRAAKEQSEAGRNYRPDAETTRKMSAEGSRYGECMTKGMTFDPAVEKE
jgi:hypothetical protein